ncbi:hypothetical protein BD408DRAFT_415566 [Parasitella parasitica]|nr:hypothetical protein BD408DRAFT_415566 [Parasitella parasitica]
MNKINIPEENLCCHHILFIKDVVNSTFVTSENCFKTESTRLRYRKARLNGIIVVAQRPLLLNEVNHIWLDDGTGVIKVILSLPLVSRKDSFLIEKGASITVFGAVQCLDDSNEIVLHCNGFKVEEDGGGVSEIHHWLKAIAERPNNLSATQANMFYSISSFPSPTRLLNDSFMASPLRDFNAANTGYLWSPDHAFATSTPLRAVMKEEIDFDDDEFDSFGEIDLVALENNALQQQQQQMQQMQRQPIVNKRKFSLSMDGCE